MTKLVNDPDDVPREAVEGLVAAHPDLLELLPPLIVRRAGAPRPGAVGVMSGGGSGHEPLHAGFVGDGMLDVAVVGPVYTAPPPAQLAAGIRAADAGAGVVAMVKNYAGDRLAFETAGELARLEGRRVETVLVDDDVAVPGASQGGRGMVGAVVAEKVAGAARDAGEDLAAVAAIARAAVAATATIGVATRASTAPYADVPGFTMDDGEIELGIGIHGEPGRERARLERVDLLVDRMLDDVVPALPASSGPSEVLLVVNGMGATPRSELFIAFRRARASLEERGLHVVRSLVGEYVTSLDMAGFSLSVTRLDPALTRLWDAPVRTPALRWGL